MTEFTNLSIAETTKVSEIHVLKHETLEVPKKPLITRDQMLEQYGYNGDLMAKLTLPSEGAEDLQVGILDFGNRDYSDDRPYMWFYEGRPVPIFGKAVSRFGLQALNYTPEEHLAAYVPIPDNDQLTIGRSSEDGKGGHANYMLGLTNSSLDSKFLRISREHLTIGIEQNRRVRITDHSTNGTTVETAVGGRLIQP